MKTNGYKVQNSPSPTSTKLTPEAVTVDEFAPWAKVGRTLVYRAMSNDPVYRGSIPFLPSLKIGRARRIILETGRAWLRDLEAQTSRSDALMVRMPTEAKMPPEDHPDRGQRLDTALIELKGERETRKRAAGAEERPSASLL